MRGREERASLEERECLSRDETRRTFADHSRRASCSCRLSSLFACRCYCAVAAQMLDNRLLTVNALLGGFTKAIIVVVPCCCCSYCCCCFYLSLIIFVSITLRVLRSPSSPCPVGGGRQSAKLPFTHTHTPRGAKQLSTHAHTHEHMRTLIF